MDIEKIQKLNSEIENFRACYEGDPLWGDRDGPVPTERLIKYLIEHPELQKIADQINNLNT